MKLTGLLIMPAGWFIVLASLALLRVAAAQDLFVAAGIGVEILGLVLLACAHGVAKGGQE